MTTPHCLRCSSTTRRLILVTNSSRSRFHLCAPCVKDTLKQMRPSSKRAVERAILEQAGVAS